MRRSSDFGAAVRSGRRAGRPSLAVHVRDGDSAAKPLVGFVVSRAVGPAVVRNRVKRRLRHLAADRLDRFTTGALVVVRANPAAAGRTHQQLAKDLDGALATLARRRDAE